MNQSISEQVKKYLNHLPTCNKMQDWLEADQAFADTPNQFRDEGYHIALQELQAKKETCTCGLDELLAGASFRESLAGKEGGGISETDMTVEEFYSGFNLDFMTEEEKQTIYTATELYAKGKLRQASQPSTAKWSDSDVKKFLEDYRVANMDCYLNPVIWFDKLNDEK